jgi:PhnB protein
MQLNPYLTFNGTCREAFKFYEQVLGGRILFSMTWGEMPGGQAPPGTENMIMHTTLSVGEARLMGADSPPDQFKQSQGIALSLHFTDPAEGERIFNALSEKGTVTMPFQKTFWAAGFGMCNDQFGIPWMVNCEQAGS